MSSLALCEFVNLTGVVMKPQSGKLQCIFLVEIASVNTIGQNRGNHLTGQSQMAINVLHGAAVITTKRDDLVNWYKVYNLVQHPGRLDLRDDWTPGQIQSGKPAHLVPLAEVDKAVYARRPWREVVVESVPLTVSDDKGIEGGAQQP